MEKNKNKNDLARVVFGLAIVMAVVLLIVVMFTAWKDISGAWNELQAGIDDLSAYYVEARDIISIDWQTQTEGSYGGSFIYGRGILEGVEYYIAFEIQEDGGIMLKKYPCDKAILYLTLEKGETAYVETEQNGFGEVRSHKIYLPKGSIMQDYELSLEG